MLALESVLFFGDVSLRRQTLNLYQIQSRFKIKSFFRGRGRTRQRGYTANSILVANLDYQVGYDTSRTRNLLQSENTLRFRWNTHFVSMKLQLFQPNGSTEKLANQT